MDLDIKINSEEYEKKKKEIKNKIKNIESALLECERYYTGLIKKNYYQRGAIFGTWKSNKSSYEKVKASWVKKRAIMGNGKPAIRLEPMRLTDELRKALFGKNTVKIGNDSISYTLKSEYGYRLHDTRPFLYYMGSADHVRSQDKKRFEKIINKYLEGAT